MLKKGFTLIEMLVTIALISTIGIVVSISLMNVVKNNNAKKEDEFVMLLEEAACAYSMLSKSNCENGCDISGETLVSEGMIDEFINGYNSSEYLVKVIYNDGLKECKIQKQVIK